MCAVKALGFTIGGWGVGVCGLCAEVSGVHAGGLGRVCWGHYVCCAS